MSCILQTLFVIDKEEGVSLFDDQDGRTLGLYLLIQYYNKYIIVEMSVQIKMNLILKLVKKQWQSS
jgi:hypothetical protein